MKTVEIIYNPYKMTTKMLIDGFDVCRDNNYDRFKEFIDNKIPLQTWIEPIKYLDWKGFVNEVSDPEINDEVTVVFSGRDIDFQDLKHSISAQNARRNKGVIYHYQHKKVLDDRVLSQNIEDAIMELKSDRFRALVEQRTTTSLREKYDKLDENYRLAKEDSFYIVLAGAYSSGKSTLLNALIKHDVLPTGNNAITSKNCRIRHDSSLGSKISLACYDENGKVVVEKKIFDSDRDCAAAFWEICPSKKEKVKDKYSTVDMMEIGVDLSHLYPESVSEDNFTIVLIDTPGMNSAQSSENGINKHAEIAMNAISMESKPMIILCTGAGSSEDKSIGEFMREIISQSKEESSGFNDRFLFLMNKCDDVHYDGQGETAEGVKRAFAEYLTDSSKWNIKGDENELMQLAESASRFVPRIFMTASYIARAIQSGAATFTLKEKREDPYKYNLNEALRGFKSRISMEQANYYLSRYCDIPDYRKDKIEEEFNAAFDADDFIRAAELQCGLNAVESAIKDYIERYAYPIKVRGLLDTFEDILEDVNGFTNGVLAELKQKEKELGEKSSEREGVSERKRGAEEKIAALEKAKENIEIQLENLNEIRFDSRSLQKALGEFRSDIEADKEVEFFRENGRISTGQRLHDEVEEEIRNRLTRIQNLFENKLGEMNNKLVKIQSTHEKQIGEIFESLQKTVDELEKVEVFRKDGYNFTNSVYWKSFSNIKLEDFVSEMMGSIVDRTGKSERVRNEKKDKWKSSWNPFKKIGSLFMDDFIEKFTYEDGYYSTGPVTRKIQDYYSSLRKEASKMDQDFMQVLDNSKGQVRKLISELVQEVEEFWTDIKTQEEFIERIESSITDLNNEIEKKDDIIKWLGSLIEKIKGG